MRIQPLQLLLLCAPLACGGRGGRYDAALSSEGPFGGATAIVSLNATDEALILVAPGRPALTVSLPALPRHLTLTPDRQTAVVATGDSQSPGLTLVDLTSAHLGERVDIPLPAGPDVVSISPDGHFALLTYDSNASTSGVGVFNPNEVVIVDLQGRTAVQSALGTDSPAPRSVAFAAPGSGGTQLTAVLFDKGLAILDLAAPENGVRVPVRSPGGPEVTPLKALFSSFVGGAGFLYILASQTDDVIAVSIAPGQGPIAAAVNFLSGGHGLADIALPLGAAPEATVLALYDQSKQAMQLDANGLVDRSVSAGLTTGGTRLVPAAGGLLLVVGTTAPR